MIFGQLQNLHQHALQNISIHGSLIGHDRYAPVVPDPTLAVVPNLFVAAGLEQQGVVEAADRNQAVLEAYAQVEAGRQGVVADTSTALGSAV